MLDQNGFNEWAMDYDNEVKESEAAGTYPFAGYSRVHQGIFETVTKKPGAVVLDLGFGTATLTKRLCDQGCAIYGQDFSSKMIELAAVKMPGAHLYQGDFRDGLAKPLRDRRYDYIVATYALHHLSDPEKVVFLRGVQGYLKENGKILIGDIAFENREQWEQCRKEAGDTWDSEESYFVFDEMKQNFPQMTFRKISFCAGILTLPG